MIRVRFAPSPTGFVHVGNARTALFNWLFAKKSGGRFILRIEDTDVERSTKEYEAQLLQDLRWLGLDWDEGPDVGGPYGPYRQSERLHLYRQHALKLIEEGKAYYCFCSPEELEEERKKAMQEGRPYVYSGKCRNIPLQEAKRRVEAGEKASVRFKVPERGTLEFDDLVRGRLSFDLSLIGDFIILRSNGMPSYNYAVVIDDRYMKITHVIRGEDHISNTPKQILIYEAFGWEKPKFAHLSMVLGPDRSRLSKRHGATSLGQFRQEGYLPEALMNYLALLGWSPPDGKELLTKQELIKRFSLDKVSRASAVFDYGKLRWLNHQHMRLLPAEELAERLLPFVEDKLPDADRDFLRLCAQLLLDSSYTLKEMALQLFALLEFEPAAKDEKASEIIRGKGREIILAFADKVKKGRRVEQVLREVSKETGARGKELYLPLRVAITGASQGLELESVFKIIKEAAERGYTLSVEERLLKFSEALGP